MSQINGTVHLLDLPPDRVCIKLPDSIQRNMVKEAHRICHNSLSKKLNISRSFLYDFENSRFGSVTLKHVIKLSDFLVENGIQKYSLIELENQIEVIKAMRARNSIKNPRFPMNFDNKSGARIVSGFLFDGGITFHLFPFYTNNEESLIQEMIKNVKEVVGDIDYNLRRHDRSETLQLEFPKILGYILVNGLGMIPGMKVLKNPPIPSFIFESKPSIQKVFLQQAFDDEGWINPCKSGRSVQLNQYHSKSELPTRLLQLKELIEKFDIPVNGPYGPTQKHRAKKGYTSYGWTIQISNQSDIRKFAEKINFSLERKRREIEELLGSYVGPIRFKKGKNLDKMIKVCRELENQDKKITIKNIAKLLNRHESHVAELTRILVKQNKLRIIKEKKSPKTYRGGFLQKEFEVKG